MADIRRGFGGRIKLRLEPEEGQLLRHLLGDHRRTLTSQADDAVTKRLFPAAYEDALDESAYRELIGDGLLNEKLEALDQVIGSLDATSITLGDEDVDAWLATIADVRLTLGIRADVDEDRMNAPLDPSAEDASAVALIHWLGWMQEMLIRHAR